MKHLRFLALLLAAALLIGFVPVINEAKADEALPYWIGVDVKNQRVTVYSTSNNAVLHRWLCSTGKSSTPTPTGTYTLPSGRNTNRKEWYKFGGVYVKYATRIVGGIYFHSVLFSKRSDNSLQTHTLNLLGHSASHGCIRLEVSNARWISENIAIGTKVIIHKGVDDTRITSVLGCNAGLAVTPSMPSPPVVKALTLDKTGTVTLGKGKTLQLNCAITPSNATTTLKWKTSKSKVAKVNDSGLVTAMGIGTATITVTAANGVKTTLKIESVDPTIAKRVTLGQKGPLYVNVGETLQLGATVEPATAATALTWKSSKPRYAAVNSSGLVTGIAKGSSKITVMTANRKKATITVKVLDPYAPAKVHLTEKGPLTMHVGETLQLHTTLTPATSKTTYTWTSGKKKVATVDANGVVTAVKKGKAKITVRTANRKKATIVIVVVD